MRSGTTLLKQIVDSHSNFCCPPETFFLGGMEMLANDRDFCKGLETMGFDEQGRIQGLKRAADFYYMTYLQAKGKSRWADKTPAYVMHLDFIERMYGPSCQYVIIYRHPFDIAESLRVKGWNFMNYDEDPFVNILKYIDDGLSRMRRFQIDQSARCHDVFYETIMAEPELSLRDLFKFLGEPWEPAVLDYHQFKHDFGWGDSEAQLLKGFRPSMGNWQSWSVGQKSIAIELLQPHLDSLGYSATESTRVGS